MQAHIHACTHKLVSGVTVISSLITESMVYVIHISSPGTR